MPRGLTRYKHLREKKQFIKGNLKAKDYAFCGYLIREENMIEHHQDMSLITCPKCRSDIRKWHIQELEKQKASYLI